MHFTTTCFLYAHDTNQRQIKHATNKRIERITFIGACHKSSSLCSPIWDKHVSVEHQIKVHKMKKMRSYTCWEYILKIQRKNPKNKHHESIV
jgi:hypothetical protein